MDKRMANLITITGGILILVAAGMVAFYRSDSPVDGAPPLQIAKGGAATENHTAAEIKKKWRHFNYPGYKFDINIFDNGAKIESRFGIMKLYSRSAWLTEDYFGFFPETIEELWEKGLVPYEISGDDYVFAKNQLSFQVSGNSFKFSSKPGTNYRHWKDNPEFKLPVDLASAPPQVVADYKYKILMLMLTNADKRTGQLVWFGEVFAPGMDVRKDKRIGKNWTLNEKFWTNPYTGRLMKQVPADSKSLGDFTVTVLKYGYQTPYVISIVGVEPAPLVPDLAKLQAEALGKD